MTPLWHNRHKLKMTQTDDNNERLIVYHCSVQAWIPAWTSQYKINGVDDFDKQKNDNYSRKKMSFHLKDVRNIQLSLPLSEVC